MRHNIVAACGKSQFQHHFIVRVGEKWPPEEMDFLQMSLAGKVAQIYQCPAAILLDHLARHVAVVKPHFVDEEKHDLKIINATLNRRNIK